MEVKAVARYVRVSARKARLVVDLIRGQKVGEASRVLKFSQKAVARDVKKVLDSAVANARENFKLTNIDDMVVAKAVVDEGPTLKRFMPRAQGRAYGIRKRTSHITIVLGN
ncbi:50S ribosomal protein L22 [Chrysiogenes arsenatis]|uniref:50S ribosomal protein L22 n=1 Tax=Chrysiogenes arsenatis TaxID=309797 RepID=UPI00040CF6F7|nr:50S ribosomal protein L22 [Chrysiogenes arsenatis]